MRVYHHNWVVDNGTPIQQRFSDAVQYRTDEFRQQATEIVRSQLGPGDLDVNPWLHRGLHYCFDVRHEDRPLFLKIINPNTDDGYLAAEAAAMVLARSRGVPAPPVEAVDTSRSIFPLSYVLQGRIPGSNMASLEKAAGIDRDRIFTQLGSIYASIHSIELDQFGFIDIDALNAGKDMQGLNRTYREYFTNQLDEHFAALRRSEFLAAEDEKEIIRLFSRFARHLDVEQAVLVQNDFGLWNFVGDVDRVSGVVDWDSVIAADPVKDLAAAFSTYGFEALRQLLKGYCERRQVPEDFEPRLGLNVVRDVLGRTLARQLWSEANLAHDHSKLLKNLAELKRASHARLQSGLDLLRRL